MLVNKNISGSLLVNWGGGGTRPRRAFYSRALLGSEANVADFKIIRLKDASPLFFQNGFLRESDLNKNLSWKLLCEEPSSFQYL